MLFFYLMYLKFRGRFIMCLFLNICLMKVIVIDLDRGENGKIIYFVVIFNN